MNAVRGVTIAPHGGDAALEVRDSAHVVLDRIRVTAAGTPFTSTLTLPGSRDVTVSRSEFSHCGDDSPEFLPVEVYVVEPLGSEKIVNVRLAGHIVKARTSPTFPEKPSRSVIAWRWRPAS